MVVELFRTKIKGMQRKHVYNDIANQNLRYLLKILLSMKFNLTIEDFQESSTTTPSQEMMMMLMMMMMMIFCFGMSFGYYQITHF